ncbi:GntR family transcriptional regulator [Methylobacillus methanolivorans]|uniref:GntR family transcriptional regulator n=1 Tax=Methylobacillus methanolivorans TaxID=1848927 RepID=A0ABW8GK19_9PROT
MQLQQPSVKEGELRKNRPPAIAERIYQAIKDDIFEFRLIPGDRFTEQEIAQRLSASRTPIRQALFRLQQEGYVEVRFRNGWQVAPFDFEKFEDLYELRIVLELDAIKRLGQFSPDHVLIALKPLSDIWLVKQDARLTDIARVSALDESFHCSLVRAAGNAEIARVHQDVSEKIRIIRRLDFTKPSRITATYDEHTQILKAILKSRSDEACRLMQSHIELSKMEVRKITIHMLHETRSI